MDGTEGRPRTEVASADHLSFTGWLWSRGWNNLSHLAGAAFLGFLASLGAGALFGCLWGLGLIVVATPIQYWRCRRAST
jgi:hypothetical protein